MLYSKCKKCFKLIPFRTTYCDECKVERDIISKENYRIYNQNSEIRKARNSREWKKLRVKILNKTKGLCFVCYVKGQYNAADHVHHIEAAHSNMDKFYNEDNLVPLCEQHHAHIHSNHIESIDKFREYIKSIRLNVLD